MVAEGGPGEHVRAFERETAANLGREPLVAAEQANVAGVGGGDGSGRLAEVDTAPVRGAVLDGFGGRHEDGRLLHGAAAGGDCEGKGAAVGAHGLLDRGHGGLPALAADFARKHGEVAVLLAQGLVAGDHVARVEQVARTGNDGDAPVLLRRDHRFVEERPGGGGFPGLGQATVEAGAAGDGLGLRLGRVDGVGDDGIAGARRGYPRRPVGVDDAGAPGVDEGVPLGPPLVGRRHPDAVLEGARGHEVLALGRAELLDAAGPGDPGGQVEDDLGAVDGEGAGDLGLAPIGADEHAEAGEACIEDGESVATAEPVVVEVPEEALVVAPDHLPGGVEDDAAVGQGAVVVGDGHAGGEPVAVLARLRPEERGHLGEGADAGAGVGVGIADVVGGVGALGEGDKLSAGFARLIEGSQETLEVLLRVLKLKGSHLAAGDGERFQGRLQSRFRLHSGTLLGSIPERCPSGLWYRSRKAVCSNAPGVRISPSPPATPEPLVFPARKRPPRSTGRAVHAPLAALTGGEATCASGLGPHAGADGVDSAGGEPDGGHVASG